MKYILTHIRNHYVHIYAVAIFIGWYSLGGNQVLDSLQRAQVLSKANQLQNPSYTTSEIKCVQC